MADDDSSDSSSDDDAPISSRLGKLNKTNNNNRAQQNDTDSDSDSDDDVPINQLNIKTPTKNGQNGNAQSNTNGTSNNKRKKTMDDSDSDSDDDAPLIAKKNVNHNNGNNGNGKKITRSMSMTSNSSSNSPIMSKKSKKRKRNRFDDSSADESPSSSDSDDDRPIFPPPAAKTKPPPKKKQRVSTPRRSTSSRDPYYSSSSTSSTPRKRKKANSSAPGYIGRECNPASRYKNKPSIIPLEPEKGALKWWEHEDDKVVSYSKADDSKSKVKWHTLDHNGVVFAPEYIPHNIPMKYDGKEIKLTPEQEEIATMYGVMLETDWVQKEKFKKNFMKEFQRILRDKNQATQHPEIKDLDKCDFRAIYDWYQNKREEEKIKKKDPEYKKKIKQEKEEYDAKYGYALVDGILEKVGNYKVEPPGLFRGRGEHPKMGMLKRRILPKHIILNIGENTPIPPCPIPGHEWGGVIHDKTVTYIAKWIENINGQHKFVYLGASSRFKGQNDRNKYEKARVLKTKIKGIRKDYTTKLTSKNTMTKQLATAVWMIDILSIRVGNEKDTDEEADTVGVCSLRKEHIELEEPEEIVDGNKNKNKSKKKKKKKKDNSDNESDSDSSDDDDIPISEQNQTKKFIYRITLDFLGKDSMRYHNTVKVTQQVYKNLRSFLAGKKDDMDIFEKIDPNKVNDYLRDQMEGLTAKVFRTHNASTTLEIELAKGYHPKTGKITAKSTLDDKKFFYDQCNMRVAILCNHQRSVSKTHGEQIQKIDQQIQDLEDAIEELQEEYDIKTGKKSKRKKKKKKDKDKDSPTKKKREKTPEQLLAAIKKKKEQLRKKQLQKESKVNNKEVALGTSKINYMDPRITVAWCKRLQVPIEKVFNKSLLDKFPWAMQSMSEYGF